MKRKLRTKTKVLMLGCFLLPLIIASPVAAETSAFMLEEIIVTADRASDSDIFHPSTVNTKIVKPGKATNVVDLLKDVTGITIQQRTLVGDNQDGTVKLRGFDARRYTVLLNGRPINAGGVMGGQYIDWGTIPLNNVEKIQIIKGAKSASYGNTLGGVINIITKDGTQENEGHLKTLWGSNNLQNYLFDYRGSKGNLNYLIAVNRIKTDPFLRNNRFESEDYTLRTSYRFANKAKITVGLHQTDADRGFILPNRQSSDPANPLYYASIDADYPLSDGDFLSPASGGPAYQLNPGAYWHKKNKYQDVTFTQPTKNGQWYVQYYNNKETRREFNYAAGNPGRMVLDRTIVSDKSSSWSFGGANKAGKHNWTYGWSKKQSRYGDATYNFLDAVYNGSATLASAGPAAQKVDLYGAYIADNWQMSDKLGIYIGLRYDEFAGSPDANPSIRNLRGHGFSPKLSVSYQNDPDTVTFASVNRVFRAPSMAEFFWWSQRYGVPGNPGGSRDLQAETGYSYELGVKKRLDRKTTYQITAYYNDLDNYIQFQHMYPFWCYNIAQAQIWGQELEFEHKINNNVTVFANYTHEKTKKAGVDSAENRDMQGALDYRPEHKGNVGLRYTSKNGAQAAASIYVVGEQKALYGGRVRTLHGYSITNMSYTHPLGADKEVSLYVNNVFNKDYQEQFGYPMQGRTIGFSYHQKI